MTANLRSLLENPKKIQRIVNIMFWGRSGSYLLSSLFDGHPDTLQLPLDNWAWYYPKFDNFACTLKESGVDCAIDEMFNLLPFLFSDWNKSNSNSLINVKFSMVRMLGEDKNSVFGCCREKLYEPLKYSLDLLSAEPDFSGADIFRLLHVCYAIATGRSISSSNPVLIVNLHVPIFETITKIDDEFAYSKFILCIRKPEDTYDSHLRHHFYETASPPFETLPVRLFEHLVTSDNLPVERSKCLAVRLEDVHKNPKEVMGSLSNWIGISWSPILLKSTLDGLIWYHEKDGIIFSGANPNFTSLKSTRMITGLDKTKFRFLFENNYIDWKYDKARLSFGRKALIFMSLFLVPYALPFSLLYKNVVVLRGDLTLRSIYNAFKHSIKFNWIIILEKIRRNSSHEIVPILDISIQPKV